MNLPEQHTKVDYKHNAPCIHFGGQWLDDLGFEMNSIVRIQCAPHQLILTTTHEDDPVGRLLSGTNAGDYPDIAECEQQRLEAYAWLHNKYPDCEELADFLDEREKYFVQASTVFDLVYILLKNGYLDW